MTFVMPNNNRILRNQEGYKKYMKVRTEKADKTIDPNDVTEIMKFIIDSYGKGEKTYDSIKAAYKLVNPNSLFVTGFLLPMLTKFTYGGNDHFEQHRSDVIKKMTHIYYTVISIEPQGKFKGTSYDHEKIQRTLLDTEADDIKKRSQLRASCGFNQKVICFFQSKSFITFDDLKYLTDCQAQIEKANKYREAFSKNKSYNKNKNNNFDINRKKINCYSLINRLTTKLTINNDSKAYIGYVKVHLMSLKNYKNCENNTGTLTIDELINSYVNEIDSPTDKSINSWELLKIIDKSSTENEFMSRLLVAPYTDVLNSQCIQDHIDVLNTYQLELKPSETAIITVVNNLTKGINLFDLQKYTNLNIGESENKLNAPAGTFFMLEAVGSSNAEIIEINDRENRYNGTAPIKLRIAETIVMDCRTERHKATDTPATHTFIGEDKEFLDEEFAEMFSPSKSAKINFNIEEIDLDGTNPKGKKYILAQDSLSLMTTAESVRISLKDPSLDFRDAMNLNKMRKEHENYENSDYNGTNNENRLNEDNI